jgi:hypothetical protein
MKTIKSSLLLPLSILLFSFAFSGCYTQLAFVNDEQDSAVEYFPTIIHQTEIVTVYVPVHIYDPPSPSPYYPISSAGSISTVTESKSQSPTRDSGYQRSGESENRPAARPTSETRPSGPTRGGR